MQKFLEARVPGGMNFEFVHTVGAAAVCQTPSKRRTDEPIREPTTSITIVAVSTSLQVTRRPNLQKTRHIRPSVRCICHGRPSFTGYEARCFKAI